MSDAVGRATDPDVDPDRFAVHHHEGRGFRQAFTHEGLGGVPLLLVHGWPETRRIWWRVIAPLAAAGFEVVVPDLRGFGDSGVGPDGLHDVVASSLDLHALLTDGLGLDDVVLCGGDFGGPIVQDLALRFPDLVERLVLFNSPLPYLKAEMAGLRTLPPAEVTDYFVRQGTDPDGLVAELATPEARRAYIAEFYTGRHWAHPGAFDDAAVAFHTAPFADAAKLRAGFGAYESVFDPDRRTDRPMFTANPDLEALLLFGPSDHVIPPDFDRMAALVFPNHVGPYLVRDCGHFVPWEAPDVLVSSLRSFCRDLLAP